MLSLPTQWLTAAGAFALVSRAGWGPGARGQDWAERRTKGAPGCPQHQVATRPCASQVCRDRTPPSSPIAPKPRWIVEPDGQVRVHAVVVAGFLRGIPGRGLRALWGPLFRHVSRPTLLQARGGASAARRPVAGRRSGHLTGGPGPPLKEPRLAGQQCGPLGCRERSGTFGPRKQACAWPGPRGHFLGCVPRVEPPARCARRSRGAPPSLPQMQGSGFRGPRNRFADHISRS